MENNIYFSIIIPVYNVEKYLRQCIESVLCQTYKNFEIILVDDGSPDNSPALCDELAKQDNRIVVIHKQNGGLSSARNAGMKLAKGKYIIFLDSDDYWQNADFLNEAYEITRNDTDIVVFKYQYFHEETGIFENVCSDFERKNFEHDSYEKRLLQLVSQQLFDTCGCNKVFSKKLIDCSDLDFTEGIIAEDIDWSARLMLSASSIDILSEINYIYRKGRAGSITTSLKPKNITDTKGSILRCLNYPELATKNDTFKRAYYGYVAYRYVIWLAENSVVKSENKKQMFNEMKQYKWLLNYDLNRKVHLAKIVSGIFGISITAKLLGLYLKKQISR